MVFLLMLIKTIKYLMNPRNFEKNVPGTGQQSLDILNDAERKAIKYAIKMNKGDKKAAMDSLKIAKTSFYEKLKKYYIAM